jgi:hypothetical protein
VLEPCDVQGDRLACRQRRERRPFCCFVFFSPSPPPPRPIFFPHDSGTLGRVGAALARPRGASRTGRERAPSATGNEGRRPAQSDASQRMRASCGLTRVVRCRGGQEWVGALARTIGRWTKAIGVSDRAQRDRGDGPRCSSAGDQGPQSAARDRHSRSRARHRSGASGGERRRRSRGGSGGRSVGRKRMKLGRASRRGQGPA